MKIKWLVGALVVLIVLNVATMGAFLYAHLHDNGWRGHRSPPMRFLENRGPREKDALFRAMRSFHEQVGPLVAETDRLDADLIASLARNPVPQEHIDSLLTVISAKRLEVARRATHHMIALGDSLSVEERQHMMSMLLQLHPGLGGPGMPPPTDGRFPPRRPW
jgi:hypothetical protein